MLRSNLLLGAGGHVRKGLLAFSVGQVGWRAALLQHGCFGVPSNTARMLPLSCRGGGMFAPRLSPLLTDLSNLALDGGLSEFLRLITVEAAESISHDRRTRS